MWTPATGLNVGGLALEQVPRDLDPYLVWALLKGASFLRDGPDGKLPQPLGVLVELRDEQNPMSGWIEGLEPTHMHSVLGLAARRTRVHSCIVRTAQDLASLVRELPSRPDAGRLRRFELSVPRAASFASTGGLIDWMSKGNDLGQEFQASGLAPLQAPGALAADDRIARRPVVCVIDDRCNLASRGLQSADGHRVATLWVQGHDAAQDERLLSAPDADRWDRPDMLGNPPADSSAGSIRGQESTSIPLRGGRHGRLLRPGRPRRDGASRQAAAAPDHTPEPRVYRDLRYHFPTQRWSHGAVVLDLIAGERVWGTRTACPASGPKKHPRRAPPEVHFVQMPNSTVHDTAGGSLAAFVLDGIHHALDQAQGTTRPVIVNVSFGTHSGAHDGSSLFDAGLRELLDGYDGRAAGQGAPARPCLHVVVPAGNSHRLRCHASGWLSGDGELAQRTLRWRVLPDDPTDSFLEIWLPRKAPITVRIVDPLGRETTLSPGHAHGVAHVLRPPTGGPGSETTKDEDRGVTAAALWIPEPPQSRHRAVLLLAVRATLDVPPPDDAIRVQTRPAAAVRGRHGVWKIQLVKDAGAAPIDFDAWVQRADAAPARAARLRGYAGRQSYLLDTDDDAIDPQTTINGIATLEHDRLHVVGAMRLSDGSLSPYSAAGPTRAPGVRFAGIDAVVPADESPNLWGLRVRGTWSGSTVRVGGTSLAAAAYTRWLYEWLAFRGEPGRPFGGGIPAMPPPEPKRAAGDPRSADPCLRGDGRRILPERPNGELD